MHNKVNRIINSLPYTDAVLMEAQRMTTIAPVTAPHRALKDTKLCGYSIPKVTIQPIKHYIRLHQL